MLSCRNVTVSCQFVKNWVLLGAIATGAAFSAAAGVTAAPAWGQVNAASRQLPPTSPPIAAPFLLGQQAGNLVVQEGDRGALVEELQQRLTELGYYDGPISGYFGELTEAAVIRFQRDRGLNPDGIVGASTTAALRQGRTPAAGSALAMGDRGEAVSQLQTRLRDLGYYDGPISSYFGELTEAAVERFQRAQGLRVDGIVGSSTRAALERAATPAAARPDPNDGLLERGETGDAVADLQRQLRALNYYQGNIDGDYGPRTEAAVIDFQRSQGLTVDGIVGPATAAALDSAATRSASPQAAVNASPEAPVGSSSPAPVAPPPAVSAAPPLPAPPTPAPTVAPAAAPPPAQLASSPAAGQASVVEIQRRLQDQGYYNGPIDGILGPETLQAIAAARENYGVQASDMLDGGL